MMWSGAIWGVPKYVTTNLEINNFKGKNEQEYLTGIFLSPINLDEYVSMKKKYI